jgi:hypothetical protein
VSQGRDGVVAAALLLPVVAGAIFSLARLSAEGGQVPRDVDYQAAAAQLEAEGFDVEQDALAVLPPWSLRPLVHTKRFSPIGSDALAERPLHRWRRLFALVEPDAAPHLDPLIAKIGAPASEQRYGVVRLLRWDLTGPRATFDFRARLRDAKVRITRDGSEAVACDGWNGREWRCPGRKRWERVESAWHLVSENGQRVVWSHPPGRGEAWEISWDDVPLGDGVVLRAGHTRDGADGAGGPVVVEVWLDDEQVGEATIPPRFDFRSYVFDTPAKKGAKGRVTVRIHADAPGRQHFAWDGWVFAGAGS